MTLVYIRHPDLRVTTVADEGVALHLGSRQYFTVNETGVTLLNALEEPRSLPELVTALTDEYDVTPELAEATAREFLDRCRDADLHRTEER
jgi:hypothetical protein